MGQRKTLEHESLLGVKVSVTRRDDGMVWLRLESPSSGAVVCADLDADEAWAVAQAMLAVKQEGAGQ